jgi:hypothetical protein
MLCKLKALSSKPNPTKKEKKKKLNQYLTGPDHNSTEHYQIFREQTILYLLKKHKIPNTF